jgi:hypothetical protein
MTRTSTAEVRKPKFVGEGRSLRLQAEVVHLRNVPDEVVERLERLAARDRMSVAALAVRELEEVSRRADNPALLCSLPDLDIDPVSVLAGMDARRVRR